MEEKDLEKVKKEMLVGTVAMTASAALIAGSVEAAASENYTDPFERDSHIVEVADVDDDDDEDKKYSAFAKIAQKVPDVLKFILSIPIWLFTHIVLAAVKKIFLKIMTPILAYLLHFLLMAILTLAIIVLIVKLLFPEKKVKEILNRKLVLYVCISDLLSDLTDFLFTKYIDGFGPYSDLYQFIFGLFVITFALIPYIQLYVKEKNKPVIIVPKIEDI